jgi:hypothetical protein
VSKTAWQVAPNGSMEAPATIKVPLIKSLLVILLIVFFSLVFAPWFLLIGKHNYIDIPI